MMNGPVSMEVRWEENYDQWEDVEVQVVWPNTQCRRYSGWRHMAHDCGTEPKGEGKSLDH